MHLEQFIYLVKIKIQNLYSKFKKVDFGSNKGFLLVDSLMSVFIISLIVSLLVPAVIGAHRLEEESSQKLEFYRTLYIDLNSGLDFNESNKYFIKSGYVYNKERTWCIESVKKE